MRHLTGEWIGHYEGHFDQVIRVEIDKNFLVARKVTGDDYVPAGEVTFCVNIDNPRDAAGIIAEAEYRNVRAVPGRLEVINPERMVFHWQGCGSVEFRKDD
jgi:hypothetical protein